VCGRREIVGKAELIGVIDDAGNLQQYPLEGDGARRFKADL
jgi:hypothetical protein